MLLSLLDLCNSGIEIEREVIDKDFFKDLMNEFKQNTSSYTSFFYFNNEKNFEKVFSRYAETDELELAYNNMKREYSLVIDETDEF